MADTATPSVLLESLLRFGRRLPAFSRVYAVIFLAKKIAPRCRAKLMQNYTVRVKWFPNNEIRAVQYRSPGCRHDRCESSGAGGDRISPGVGSDGCGDGPAPTLDISSELSVSLSLQRPGFGGRPRVTRFGLNAKRTLQRAAGALPGAGIVPSECVMLTGTIPGSTSESFDAFADWSSWAVKKLKTWLHGRGVTNPYGLYVWELQKRGALHIHYCAVIPDESVRLDVLSSWKEFWSSVVDAVSARAGVDCWARKRGGTWAGNKAVLQADAQVVQKSVAAYLAKYLSKDAGKCCRRPDGSLVSGPVRWWGVSRPLLAALESQTEEFEIPAVPQRRIHRVWDRIVDTLRGFVNGCSEYCDKLGFARVCVGYGSDAGVLYNELWRDLYAKRIVVPWSTV
jgi:hypothetical protein